MYFWLKLIDVSGKDYTSARMARIDPPQTVAQLIQFTENNVSEIPKKSVMEVQVYENMERFGQKQSMEINRTIEGLGQTKDSALIVMIPVCCKNDLLLIISTLAICIGFWYRLYDHSGKSITPKAASLKISAFATVENLLENIQNSYSETVMRRIHYSELSAYKNKRAWQRKEDCFDPAVIIESLGNNQEDSLIVVLPSSSSHHEDTLCNITGRFLDLTIKQKSASAFTAGQLDSITNCGFNGCFKTSFNLPEIVQGIYETVVEQNTLDGAIEAVSSGRLFSVFPKLVKEDEKSGVKCVQSHLYNHLGQYFGIKGKLFVSEKTELQNFKACNGIASPLSKPDMVIATENNDVKVILAVFEFKDTSKSPLDQQGQAVVSATNAALRLLAFGFNSQQIAIPIVMTNGNLYQFGWVTLLEPSFPVVHITTDVLDASGGCEEIARNLALVKTFCLNQAEKLLSEIPILGVQPQPALNIMLSEEKYFRKSKQNIFLRTNDELDSLKYLWSMFHLLKDIEDAVKPLCFADLDYWISGQQCYYPGCLLFPHLDPSYQMGMPVDEEHFNWYLAKLKALLISVHSAGVVHMDVYASNVMWKLTDDGKSIDVKLIDWDAATRIGDQLTDKIRLRLSRHSVSYLRQVSVAEAKCDALYLFVCSEMTGEDRRECSGKDVFDINKAFNQVQARLDPIITQNFNQWFSDNWH